VHYVVGGSTKVDGAGLPRLREREFAAVEHHEGPGLTIAAEGLRVVAESALTG
jgi:hypothetical protein